MARKVKNLINSVKIAKPDGTPTSEFMRLIQETGLLTQSAQDILEQLILVQIIAGDGLDGGGTLGDFANITLTADVQEILDQLTTTQGAVLYRSATGWTFLAPGTAGQVLTTNGAAANPSWEYAGSGNLTVRTQTGTTYTAVLGDADDYIQFTSASAVAFTIPPNTSVAFPVDTIITIEQNNTGAVTFTPGGGVTFRGLNSAFTTSGQYGVAQAKKTATDTWTILGDVVP